MTPEDVKYVLSSHYQGTPYDPYRSYGDKASKGAYRSIGINRNDFMALIQLRPDVDAENCALEWIAYASNAFNTMVPFYAHDPHHLRLPRSSYYFAKQLRNC